MKDGVQCLESGKKVSATACNLGATYDILPTFEVLPNVSFHEKYGSGETLSGIVGYDEVTLVGITVKRQEIGLAQSGSFVCPGKISGLMGIAYPSAHTSDNETITPVFTNMYKEGLVAPVFSMAIDRIPINITHSKGGYLALGALPPVKHSPNFARASIVTIPGSQLNATTGKPGHEWYSIIIDGVMYGKTFNDSKYEMIIDSGTPWNVFPPATAHAINAMFDPPAILDPESGISVVNCAAKPPLLGVKIGGEMFYHKGEDLLFTNGTICLSSIIPNSGLDLPGVGVVNIHGDTFMKNVVAVFDVGGSEMRFAAREDY